MSSNARTVGTGADRGTKSSDTHWEAERYVRYGGTLELLWTDISLWYTHETGPKLVLKKRELKIWIQRA